MHFLASNPSKIWRNLQNLLDDYGLISETRVNTGSWMYKHHFLNKNDTLRADKYPSQTISTLESNNH